MAMRLNRIDVTCQKSRHAFVGNAVCPANKKIFGLHTFPANKFPSALEKPLIKRFLAYKEFPCSTWRHKTKCD